MTTFTAKFQRDGEQPRWLPNMINHKGYLVQVKEVGRGKATEKGVMTSDGDGDCWTEYERYETILRPFWDKNLMTPAETAIARTIETFAQAVEKGYEKYLLRIEGGADYTIVDADEAKAKKVEDDKIVYFETHPCWETGIVWYELRGRYPEHVFNAMRSILTYHSQQEEEEGDWKGWCVPGSLAYIKEALSEIGWTAKP